MGSCQNKERNKYNNASDYIMQKSKSKSLKQSKTIKEDLLKERIFALFDEYDTDKDGKLSEVELQRFLKAVYVKKEDNKKQQNELIEQLMGAMDRNRNRQIDKDEFYQYYKS